MNCQYTIEDLASKCQVSKQSIYALIKKNKDFVNQNSRKQGRQIKYNQAVLDLFLDYYGKQAGEEAVPEESDQAQTEAPEAESKPEEETVEGVPEGEEPSQDKQETSESEPAAAAEETPDEPEREDTVSLKKQIASLTEERDALRDRVQELEKKLAETEAERKSLFTQNGALLLMLQQEKQEKMLYLPKPKKTIGERIKGWFKKGEPSS